MTRVRIDSRAADAYGISGELPVGALIILAGLVVRVREDGGLDEIGAGGHPRGGIAADPTAAGMSCNARHKLTTRTRPRKAY